MLFYWGKKMEEKFYEKIKKYRRFRGKSQQEMADFIGLNRSTYLKKESTGSFYCDEMVKVCEFLNIDVSTLFSDTPKKINTTKAAPRRTRVQVCLKAVRRKKEVEG